MKASRFGWNGPATVAKTFGARGLMRLVATIVTREHGASNEQHDAFLIGSVVGTGFSAGDLMARSGAALTAGGHNRLEMIATQSSTEAE